MDFVQPAACAGVEEASSAKAETVTGPGASASEGQTTQGGVPSLQELRLKNVQVIMRHGARMPLHKLQQDDVRDEIVT